MQAIILVGGLGTRLRSVINDRPKPMAPVVNKPFVEYLLDQLEEADITEVIFAVGYKGEVIEEYFGNGNAWGMKIQYAYERELLGTAGAIKNAQHYITGAYTLVMNGDTYYKMDYNAIIQSRKKEPDMTIVLREVQDASRYGKVTLKGDIITGFNEKELTVMPGLINGGVYLMKSNLINDIPDGKVSLEKEMIPSWLAEGKVVKGIVNNQYFIDIGVPKDYIRFNDDIIARNYQYSKKMIERLDEILRMDKISAASPCVVSWMQEMRLYLQSVYGVNSEEYRKFTSLRLEPESISCSGDIRKEVTDYCKKQLTWVADKLKKSFVVKESLKSNRKVK